MTEEPFEDLDYLNKEERLSRLTGPETPIVIDKSQASTWRTAINKFYKDHPIPETKFAVRTAKKDNVTRVIKIR